MDPLTPAAPDASACVGSLERIRRFDRQTTLERVISYLAHSLGSPLNVIEGRAAMMAGGHIGDEEVKRNARIIGEQSARMVQFLRAIVSSTHRESNGAPAAQAADDELVDLAAIATSAVTMFRPIAQAQGRAISFEGNAGAARVSGNAESLLIALSHVLENGIRATPEGGTLTVRLRHQSEPEEALDPAGIRVPFFCVDVDDEGPGIKAAVLPQLFQPFTTNEDDRQAVGLGLFVAQSIAKEHGGWLEGVNKGGKGACFTLHLPEGHADAE
ncbi:MAG TPA: HAMP domain-containing sensor histidine kinase [Polyangiaceae bacterium]